MKLKVFGSAKGDEAKMANNRERIIEYLATKGESNLSQIRDNLNLDWRTVALNIADLKSQGLIIEKGRMGICRVVDIKRD